MCETLDDLTYDPACAACRKAAGKDLAGTTWECRIHVIDRLTRERDDARTEAELMKQAGRVLEQQRDEARAELAAARQAWAVELEAAQSQRDEARAERDKGADAFVLMTRNYADLVADRDRLRALLREVRPCRCDDLHHAKRDRHDIGEPCPVLARIDAALEGQE